MLSQRHADKQVLQVLMKSFKHHITAMKSIKTAILGTQDTILKWLKHKSELLII